MTSLYINSLAISDNNIFAGTERGGIFLSTDNGSSWAAVNNGLTSIYVLSLAVSGTNIFAGTYRDGVFLSTNNGTNWTAVNNGLMGTLIWSLSVSDTNLFAGTDNGGVFLSTNNGTSWSAVNNGLTTFDVRALAVSNTNLFAGTYGSGVLIRPLSEMITFVERHSTDLPSSFKLDQNYPNPFNPSTKITYSIPGYGFVSLIVYNSLGQAVETLISENQSAGRYIVDFNAEGLSSGIYYYRLQFDKIFETKKIVLLIHHQ